MARTEFGSLPCACWHRSRACHSWPTPPLCQALSGSCSANASSSAGRRFDQGFKLLLGDGGEPERLLGLAA